MNLEFSIRPLVADDAEAYRALRQGVLLAGGGRYFSDSYVREQSFTSLDDWRAWCAETDKHCIIGTFHGAALIGIMGVIAYGDPSEKTVEWELTWLDPRYRGTGLAQAAYEMEHRWSVEKGFSNAVVFIRQDNVRSIAIRRKQGFELFGSKKEEWADGSVATALCFRKSLSEHSIKRFAALRFLDQTVNELSPTVMIDQTLQRSDRLRA